MLLDEGPGFPFFLPKGMVLKNTAASTTGAQVHKKYGYVEISTPIILNRKLWERSGHWDHYKDNMYTTVIDDEDLRHQAHELPRRHAGLPERSPTPTGICPCGWASWAWSTAMSSPAPSTACSGCAASPRTMPTSS